MLPTTSSTFVTQPRSTELPQTPNQTNSADRNKVTHEMQTNNELNSKPEWIRNWLRQATIEGRIAEKDHHPCPSRGSKIAVEGIQLHTDSAKVDGIARQNVVLLEKPGATMEEASLKKRRICICTSIRPRVSFDSLDSSTTSGLSLGSFRIGANRDSPTSVQSELQDRLEKKLLAAGVLENCTRLLQNLTTDNGALPDPTCAAIGQALSNEDASSVMKVVVATVSLGIDLKSSRTLNQFAQQRLRTVERRERQLEDLKERRWRENRNPEALKLEKQNREMEKTIQVFSAHNFQLKRNLREVAIEIGNLREAEKDATVTVRSLYNCKDKYIRVCDENRDLNKTVQQLQGGVRVLCQLSQSPRHTVGYLTSQNRGEITLKQKQKTRTFNVDAVATGPPSTSSFRDDMLPVLTSVLDGFDATIVNMGSCSCDFENAGYAGGFVGTLACMISTLLDAANGRFYHESYMFDFEILLITPEASILFAEKTNLITAMVSGDDQYGLTDVTMANYDKVRQLLTDTFSRTDLHDTERNAHVVLRLAVHRRHKPTNVKSTSEITFIQVNASSSGRWVQDKDVSGLVSALINISSGKLQKDQDAKDNLIIQELFRPTKNDRLYTLLIQLQNEPVHEKTNLAALTMCNDIIQARTIKDSSSAWTGPGSKKIAQLEKSIGEKDKLISGMTKQREKVEQDKGELETDIERLKAQIAALKNTKSKREKTPKAVASTKASAFTHDTPLDQTKSTSSGIAFRERTTTKKTTTATRKITRESRIPRPKAPSVPPNIKRIQCSERDLSLTIKTCVKTEELTMVTKIHRPSPSRLSRLPRDSKQ